jgi:pimeloyl-ACP methyl ester carboxylesterase
LLPYCALRTKSQSAFQQIGSIELGFRSPFSSPLSPMPTVHLLTPAGANPRRPLFVYFPGMDGSGTLFSRQIPALHAHFEVRCLALSRYHRWTWEDLATETISLIATAAAGRRVYLCGESFGACWALQVVSQAPHIAERLILVNSASAFQRLPWLPWLGQITPWVPSMVYPLSTLGSLPLLANLNCLGATERQQLWQTVQAVPQATVAWRMERLAQFRLEALALTAWTRPTLLVAALADRLLPSLEEAQRLTTWLPQAHLYTLPHSGHACLLEQEVRLSEILAEIGFSPQKSAVLA